MTCYKKNVTRCYDAYLKDIYIHEYIFTVDV